VTEERGVEPPGGSGGSLPRAGPSGGPGVVLRASTAQCPSKLASVTDTTAVEICDLVKRYGHTTAVDGLSLRARRGAVTAVLGPNGAGKTTTIEICEGYRRPDAGRVTVLGLDPVADARALRPRVGVMLQSGGIPPAVRPGEYLGVLARFHAHPLDPVWLLDRLGLTAAARTPVRRLSGGQQQRVSLAAAVIGRPELVFLDEPTSGLDPQARHATWGLIAGLRASGASVILTTHHMDEAERLADHVVIVDHGKLVAEGTPAELTGTAGQVRFRAEPGLDIEGLVAALPVGSAAKESPAGHYLVEVHNRVDPRLVAAVTAWCAEHGVLAQELRIESRTLEDVFLELTGRELRS
jgi:ABC-2 type transport system ATP-binding protein